MTKGGGTRGSSYQMILLCYLLCWVTKEQPSIKMEQELERKEIGGDPEKHWEGIEELL